MSHPTPRGGSLALLTDLYELTMAYGYWKSKMVDHQAIFHLFFRKPPFQGGYAVASGLEAIVDYLADYRFDASDLEYLATLKNGLGAPLFESAFLDYLAALRFSSDIDMVAEGELVFPFEPLLRIQGPLIEAQLLEPALLTLINFPTLIATKAMRLAESAMGDSIIEFGLRRAQGMDGALTASRAAFVGGCTATSNVLAGKRYGIPVSGTHAHSWVMAFDTEMEAFEAYAKAMPDNVVFLVDTYDTESGVKHAIEVARRLKAEGRKFLGIRLDSGNLDDLSEKSRRLLDEAGFSDARIIASNELDEWQIAELKAKGAPIAVWGVGTSLVTGRGQGALDGVYKLSAIKKPSQGWHYCLKLSEKKSKISDPGALQIRRFFDGNHYVGDAIYDLLLPPQENKWQIVDSQESSKEIEMQSLPSRDLLKPIFRSGKRVYDLPKLTDIQSFAKQEIKKLPPSCRTLASPSRYFVGYERSLYENKCRLVERSTLS